MNGRGGWIRRPLIRTQSSREERRFPKPKGTGSTPVGCIGLRPKCSRYGVVTAGKRVEVPSVHPCCLAALVQPGVDARLSIERSRVQIPHVALGIVPDAGFWTRLLIGTSGVRFSSIPLEKLLLWRCHATETGPAFPFGIVGKRSCHRPFKSVITGSNPVGPTLFGV